MADALSQHQWSSCIFVSYQEYDCTVACTSVYTGKEQLWTIVPEPNKGIGTRLSLDDARLIDVQALQPGMELKYWGTKASKRLFGIRAYSMDTGTGAVMFRDEPFAELRWARSPEG